MKSVTFVGNAPSINVTMTTVYTFKSSRQNWKEIQNAAETTTCFAITSKDLRISEYFSKSCMDPKDLQRTQQDCGQMVGEP